MANNANIRTMQDDINDAKKIPEGQIKQQQGPQAQEVNKEKIIKQPIQTKPTQSNQFSSRQTVGLDLQNFDKYSSISRKENRKPIFIPPENNTPQFSKKTNNEKSNELKDLIKRISNEADRDHGDNKILKIDKIEKKEILQEEKNDDAKKKTEAIKEKTLQEIADDLTKNNSAKAKSAEEMENLKKDLDKIEAEEKIREKKTAEDNTKKIEILEKNAKEIEDLKKMINRISESSKANRKTEIEKNIIETKETEISKKSAEEMENLKKDLDKIEAEEKIREAKAAERSAKEIEVLERNIKEIENLKEMISHISESSNIEANGEAETDNVKKLKEISPENDNIELQDQNYKQNIQRDAQFMETQENKGESAFIPSNKKENKSFWKNVFEQTKKTANSKKIDDFNHGNIVPEIKASKDEKLEKYSEQSGILQNNNQKEELQAKKSLYKKAYYENYAPPSERLAWGKQEFYSSVIKKINPREEKGELESLKNADMIKKRKILSKDEEYKKLKYSIAKKYHINLFALPWKKIIFVAIVVIALVGAISFFVFSDNNPFAPPTTPAIVIGSEIEKFSSMEKEITIYKKDFEGFNNLELEALNIFNSENNTKIIKLLIVNNNKEILSLSEALGSMRIINTKENINYLPDKFLQTATNNYNIFIFKTDKGTIRYGMAIKTNNKDFLFSIMRDWEKEEAKNKKMSSVFKPLFVNDKNFEDALTHFSTSFYKNIEIRYVHLVNKDTALNYFFYEDVLIFTTSKDTTFATIDYLTSGN